MIRRQLVVHGRVQGVFYRESCRREALRQGVNGWVRNRPDGTVEVHLEGRPDAVAAMVDWAGRGPRDAVVERVESADEEPTGEAGFAVR